MPKLYNEEKMRAVLGPYRIGTIDDLNEDGLLRIVRMRRRQLGQMTQALDTETAKRRIPDGEYRISQKIDGEFAMLIYRCLLYTSPSPRDQRGSRMPSSA